MLFSAHASENAVRHRRADKQHIIPFNNSVDNISTFDIDNVNSSKGIALLFQDLVLSKPCISNFHKPTKLAKNLYNGKS